MECFDTVTHDINLCHDFGKKTKVLFLKYSFFFYSADGQQQIGNRISKDNKITCLLVYSM